MRNKPGSDLLESGEYDAVIVQADDKISTSGNEMIEMILAVYDHEGNDTAVMDWITNSPRRQWKIRHLCDSAGIVYERSDLPADDFKGRNVRVVVEKSKDAKYGWQNRITDYLPRDAKSPDRVFSGSAPIPSNADDPDIPF